MCVCACVCLFFRFVFFLGGGGGLKNTKLKSTCSKMVTNHSDLKMQCTILIWQFWTACADAVVPMWPGMHGILAQGNGEAPHLIGHLLVNLGFWMCRFSFFLVSFSNRLNTCFCHQHILIKAHSNYQIQHYHVLSNNHHLIRGASYQKTNMVSNRLVYSKTNSTCGVW